MSTDNNKTAKPEGQPSKLRSRKSMIILVLLLLLLAAANIALYWLMQQSQQQLLEVQTQLSALDGTDARISELQTQHQQQQLQLREIREQDKQLAEQLDALKHTPSLSDQDVSLQWGLAEVKYLLTIANQRSTLAHDPEGALKALQLADNKLQQIDDNRLNELRALIADEVLALTAVAKLDITGMALQLESAINTVDNLRVIRGPELAENAADPQADPAAQAPTEWQKAARDIWKQLQSLVVIRHQQDGSAAVLVPEQRYFLYQNLRLKLETARFALLSGKSSVYQASLASASDWLTQYFVGDKRDAMLKVVAELQRKNITEQMPDISASLRWIGAFQP